MNVNFNLRDQKAKNKTSIILVVFHYGKSLKWSTRMDIPPTLWDAKKQRPKLGEYPLIRENLNRLEKIAEELLLSSGALTQPEFSEKMKLLSGYKEAPKNHFLLEFIKDYCINQNERQALRATATLIYNFVTGENATEWRKIDWGKARLKDVPFDSIDWNFRTRFIRYCFDQNFTVSYVQSNINRLGQFINVSRQAGYHTNNVSQESKFGVVQSAGIKKAKNIPIALTIEEVKRLAALELTGLEERVRDCFLIGVLSGQRWSDYGFIEEHQIRDGFLKIHQQQKTGTRVKVKLELFKVMFGFSLGELLAKYGNRSPIISNGDKGINQGGNQIMNKVLKNLCKKAGIDEVVRWSDDRGGKMKEYTFKKYELVATHTARRTCATILYNKELPLELIKSITGHTTVEQLLRYIGATEDEMIKRLDNAMARVNAELMAEKEAI